MIQQIQASTKPKVVWVDNLKVFGIIAVILGHMNSPYGTFIYSWHMPLFFMLSGFFLRTDEALTAFVRRSFKRLMVPYFIFALIGLGVEITKRHFLGRDSLNLWLNFKAIAYHMTMQSLADQYGFVLWFLPALFAGRIMVYLIIKHLRAPYVQTIGIIMGFCASFYLNLPFGLSNGLNAALFIFSGYYFYKYALNNSYCNLLAVVVIAIIALSRGMPELNMAKVYYSMPVLNVLWALACVVVLTMVFRRIKVPLSLQALRSSWAQNMLGLFILHPYTNNIAYLLSSHIHTGRWVIQLLLSLLLLQLVLMLALKIQSHHARFKL